MAAPAKGTVTPLASMFPTEEAHKAAKRVDNAISEKQKELDHINEFIADNTNLINLVSRLPDDLHHDVMVPFGKAAFFPGRLIHTNELMVLLGEGYYAERTSKQTVEILKRRGKGLDSQVDSIKANMKDLRAQASFFDSTAAEAAEGLVEIREDYEEDNLIEEQAKSETQGKKVIVEDDEYDRIMSRLNELEKEELAAEDEDEDEDEEEDEEEDEDEDEDELAKIVESDEEEQTNAAERKNVFNVLLSQGRSGIMKPQGQKEVQNATAELLSNKYHHQLDISEKSNCTGLTVQPVPKDDMQNCRSVTQVKKSVPTEKAMLLPQVMEKMERNEALTGSIVEKSSNLRTNLENQTVTSSQKPGWSSKSGFDSSKAFTGSIVERTHNLPTFREQTSTSSQASDSQPTRPVSRFKMQRK
ncbi:Prefoldin chaperone subunit family protein [Euphorbia peplus]|nr:Prefoldin chaperone subunit family protein [Euphorbia peplus]